MLAVWQTCSSCPAGWPACGARVPRMARAALAAPALGATTGATTMAVPVAVPCGAAVPNAVRLDCASTGAAARNGWPCGPDENGGVARPPGDACECVDAAAVLLPAPSEEPSARSFLRNLKPLEETLSFAVPVGPVRARFFVLPTPAQTCK